MTASHSSPSQHCSHCGLMDQHPCSCFMPLLGCGTAVLMPSLGCSTIALSAPCRRCCSTFYNEGIGSEARNCRSLICRRCYASRTVRVCGAFLLGVCVAFLFGACVAVLHELTELAGRDAASLL